MQQAVIKEIRAKFYPTSIKDKVRCNNGTGFFINWRDFDAVQTNNEIYKLGGYCVYHPLPRSYWFTSKCVLTIIYHGIVVERIDCLDLGREINKIIVTYIF